MHPGSEECLHLLRSDRIAGTEAIDAGQTGADPRSWSLSAFGVVGRQPDMALLGGV
jgi:hypothetical protein